MERRSSAYAIGREEELELLDGLIAGEESAWRRFHQQYGRLIHRCIRKATYRFSAVVRGEDEREIYSNLLVQLLSNDKRKLRRFEADRGSRLSTWLGLLATHAAYDYLRSLRREVPRVPLSEATTAHANCASPFEEVVHRQQSRMVGRMMSKLSPKDREFVALYYARGLSPEDVATEMKISVKTVY
ncbi:MAG: sigma-70 family RNA polymerase sigma factor [Deltaproteobacteria bacterium]|jgi:RNA polymerase sigma-70 factor (ECF subfamily)|nr:sigma-70 family RNA polymerase sigma factor [Deltaproteobacteria bacterium]MBW2537756.1 sigma-70 family RNA polymerase sigma factor [Deltaproteobacteria bacterium]